MTFQNKINNNKSNINPDSGDKVSSQTTGRLDIRNRIRNFIDRAKKLEGDPTYIARGMAIGVFIGVTPTIPFHTAIAIALAFIFNASKPAAIVDVWFSNPLTIPIFYYGSYKVGALLFHLEIPSNFKEMPVSQIVELGAEVTVAGICGGVIFGAPFGIAAFFLTRFLFQRLRLKRKTEREHLG